MARRSRKSSPPLYDLIKSRPADGRDEVEPVPEMTHVVETPEPRSRFGPGRLVAVPVGYLLLAAAVVVLLTVAAYTIGYGRATRAVEDEYGRMLARVGTSADQPRARDPLMTTEPGVLGRPDPGPGEGGPSVRPPEPRSGDADAVAGWGPIDRDPRRPGYKYMVLIETTQEGARRLAEYSRESGLETYVVVSHNNPSRRLVIALPGFSPEVSSSSPEMQTLRRRIHEIGDRWKRYKGGATDLHDAYPLTFPAQSR